MSILGDLRSTYSVELKRNLIGYRPDKHVVNIADSGSKQSREISEALLKRLPGASHTIRKSSQTLGREFSELVASFVRVGMGALEHVRPGPWSVTTTQSGVGIAAYDQYRHLDAVRRALDQNPELKTFFGEDYLVTPDIIVAREPVTPGDLNRNGVVVELSEPIARYTPLVGPEGSTSLLHASISCKWTIRSDRAQNTRTEALNMIRNRKGRVPHIVSVTMEPTPSRLASIALGTGDIDCTYHGALSELIDAVAEVGTEAAQDQLKVLVDGRRLRDLSDLPLDLAT